MVITKFSGMEFISEAIIIATAAHDGQYSGDGNPYILHPLRVMSYMNNNFARILAVLHDVLRDSQEYNQQIILEKFDNHVLCPLHVSHTNLMMIILQEYAVACIQKCEKSSL